VDAHTEERRGRRRSNVGRVLVLNILPRRRRGRFNVSGVLVLNNLPAAARKRESRPAESPLELEALDGSVTSLQEDHSA
jgi:hypothetical protein